MATDETGMAGAFEALRARPPKNVTDSNGLAVRSVSLITGGEKLVNAGGEMFLCERFLTGGFFVHEPDHGEPLFNVGQWVRYKGAQTGFPIGQMGYAGGAWRLTSSTHEAAPTQDWPLAEDYEPFSPEPEPEPEPAPYEDGEWVRWRNADPFQGERTLCVNGVWRVSSSADTPDRLMCGYARADELVKCAPPAPDPTPSYICPSCHKPGDSKILCELCRTAPEPEAPPCPEGCELWPRDPKSIAVAFVYPAHTYGASLYMSECIDNPAWCSNMWARKRKDGKWVVAVGGQQRMWWHPTVEWWMLVSEPDDAQSAEPPHHAVMRKAT